MSAWNRHETRTAGLVWAGGVLLAAAVLISGAGPAGAAVTVLQQGVSPTPEYSGCIDTCIAGGGWAHDRPSGRPKAISLRVVHRNGALIRFDLAGIGKVGAVRRAILRLSFTNGRAIPAPDQEVKVFTFGRAWDETATWYEYTYLDAKKTDANNWTKPGGDVDQTDFGKGEPGLVAKERVRAGPFGHIVELDVTRLAAEWVAGKRENHGFLIVADRGVFQVASSEWPMGPYRPALVIEHYGPGEARGPKVSLHLPTAAGPKALLAPIAGTPNVTESAAPTAVVRFGRNSNCQYRTGHVAGYAKQDIRYPGNWGWTPRLRVGGSAGDLNHVLFRFNLAAIPKDAVIKRATLKAFADVGNMRVPEDTMGQAPKPTIGDERRRLGQALARARGLAGYSLGLFRVVGDGDSPNWAENEFTFAEGTAGKAWTVTGGTLFDATEAAPAAVCDVGAQWADLLKKSDRMPETWLEWDVTGLVRAWVQGRTPNRGVVVDARLMGGEAVLFSDDWTEPDRRPYIEVELAAKLPPGDGPLKPEAIAPTGDYWVEPMRKAHAKWKGAKGTFAQYGDSITVTMAFWTPLKYGERKGITPEMKTARETARRYIHKDVWRTWKGGRWGNTGSTTVGWGFDHIDEWQKRMNPEAAVLMWGTNDAYLGPSVPIYTEQYAAVINRILKDGTVPIITTLPPRSSQRGSVSAFLTVWNFRQATIFIARAKHVPLIDLWAEMVRRRPDDWDGRLEKFKDYKGYDVPTLIARDGIHPSNSSPHRNDWTDEGLRCNGFCLRNYLTLKQWYAIYRNVLAAE